MSDEFSAKEACFVVWDQVEPRSFRQAKNAVADVFGVKRITEGSLRVYYSKWRKANGIQRRYVRRVKNE